MIVKKNFTLTAAGHDLAAEWIEFDVMEHARGKATLVFLHEGLGCIPLWRDFPHVLCEATGCCGLVYDRWGYGNSDPLPTVGSRRSRYMHDEALYSLPEVLERCEIDNAILIGHSDGGSIALVYSAVYAGKVRGVITEAAHVFVEDVTLHGIRKAAASFETTDLREKLAKYHGTNTVSMFHGWADTWLSPEFRDWNIVEYLPRISVPLLVIQGEGDEYGTPAQIDAIVTGVTGPAKRCLIPNCGHVPHHQARDTVIDEMKAFILKLVSEDV